MLENIKEKLWNLIFYIFGSKVKLTNFDYLTMENHYEEIIKQRELTHNEVNYKTQINLADGIFLEIFETKNKFIASVSAYDICSGLNKEELIKQIRAKCTHKFYLYLHLKVQSKINEILAILENIDSDYPIRIFYSEIDNMISMYKKHHPNVTYADMIIA